MEQQPIDTIENTLSVGTHNSSDCPSTSLVKAIGKSEPLPYASTACGPSDCDNQNSSNQIGMVTDAPIDERLEAKQLELMGINDDCLSVIFKHLTVWDMVSFADVCKRFRSIARKEFCFAKPIVRIPQDVGRQWYETEGETIRRTSRLFEIFGSSMTELEVKSVSAKFDEKIVALMIEYCCGGKLTTLNLQLHRMEKLPIGLKLIFNKLRKLDLWGIAENEATVYEWLDAVEDLTLSYGYRSPCAAFFKRSFVNLRRIYMSYVSVGSHDLAMFLNKNKTIKDIALTLPDHVTDIFEQMTQIEHLELTGITESHYLRIETSSFGKLNNLKSLLFNIHPAAINFVAGIVREIVAANIPMQQLKLGYIKLEMSSECQKLCENLSKLIHLDTFILRCGYTTHVNVLKHFSSMLHRVSDLRICVPKETIFAVDEIITILNCFHNLKRLVIYNHIYDEWEHVVIDSKSFEALVKIVQKQNKGTRLDIGFIDQCYKVDIPVELAHRHRHIMSVQVLTVRQRYELEMSLIKN